MTVKIPTYTETTLPTFDEVNKANGGADLGKSHLAAGVVSRVNGEEHRAPAPVEISQVVNGVVVK